MSHSLVTTGALKGTELLNHVQPAEKILSVGCSDDVARWLRIENPMCSGSLHADLRVVTYSDTWALRPDTELVRRLTLLPNIKFLVVESDEPAIVVGVMETQQLARRRDEAFEFAEADEDQEAEVELHLQEMLEDARRAGMSSSGVEKAKHLVCDKYRDVWRTNLGPEDFVDLASKSLVNSGSQNLTCGDIREGDGKPR